MSQVIAAGKSDPLRVLIAGGGVAAVEAMLALRALAGSAVDIHLIAPEPEFAYNPTSVAEPFGLSERRVYDVGEIAREKGAHVVRDSFGALDAERRVVTTSHGAEIEYGALLLAIGARRIEALPGALTFRGSADSDSFAALVARLESGESRRLAFVVPPGVRWALALYELALLTSAHLAARKAGRAQLVLVTHEPAPMSLFGDEASHAVARLLDDAGVTVHTGAQVEGIEDGRLHVADGSAIEMDEAVALPRLTVPELPGVPQGTDGFIPTNDYGGVESLLRVYAAGDATWFPIKQGGIAAQQADVAAASIAVCAGVKLVPQRFRPVLRGVMLTGGAPVYLRSSIGERDATSASGPDALWWPPAKVAGRYLASYLARDERETPLEDLETVAGEPGYGGEEHTAALELALSAADANARWGDHAAALRWLGVAEQLNVVLPPGYAEKRRRWAATS